MENNAYIEILSTYNQQDIAMIKSILDSENIEYILNNELFSSVRPLIEPIALLVKKDYVEKAKDLLSGYNFKLFPLNKDKPK